MCADLSEPCRQLTTWPRLPRLVRDLFKPPVGPFNRTVECDGFGRAQIMRGVDLDDPAPSVSAVARSVKHSVPGTGTGPAPGSDRLLLDIALVRSGKRPRLIDWCHPVKGGIARCVRLSPRGRLDRNSRHAGRCDRGADRGRSSTFRHLPRSAGRHISPARQRFPGSPPTPRGHPPGSYPTVRR